MGKFLADGRKSLTEVNPTQPFPIMWITLETPCSATLLHLHSRRRPTRRCPRSQRRRRGRGRAAAEVRGGSPRACRAGSLAGRRSTTRSTRRSPSRRSEHSKTFHFSFKGCVNAGMRFITLLRVKCPVIVGGYGMEHVVSAFGCM